MKTILVDAWNTFVTQEGVNGEMKQLLDRFPNPKIIVTNANAEEKIRFGMVNLPFELFSLAHQPNKTDSNYFIQLFEKFSLNAADVVYFEHNNEAISSAQSLGIKSFWYDPELQDLNALEQFLKKSV